MALADLVSSLLNPLLEKVKQALGPFGKLFDLLGKFWQNLKTAYSTGIELAQEIRSEIIAWKNFRESIPYRTGVISVPKAIERTQQLVDQLVAAWHSVVDLLQQIKTQLQGQQQSPVEEAEQAAADIEGSGIRGILEKFPKLAKGLEKLLGFVAVIVGVLETLVSTLNDLKAIVDALRAIREEVEEGATVFLQQKNQRKIVRLDDGSTMKIRLGSLHS